MLTTEEILSLPVSSSCESVDRFITERLNIKIVYRGFRKLKYLIPSAGKIRNHTLQEDQEFGLVFLLCGNTSLDKIS